MRIKLTHLVAMFAGTLCSPLMANSLQDVLTNSEQVIVGKIETVDGFGGVANYIITKPGLISEGGPYFLSKSGSFTLNSEGESVTITTDAFDSQSVTYINVFSETDREFWGESALDQLEKAYHQGLISESQSYDRITGTEAIVISNYDESEGTATLTRTVFNTLIIPQNVIDNIEGGWQGPSQIKVNFTTELMDTGLFAVEESSLLELDDFLKKQWILPLYAEVDFYYGASLSAVSDLSGEISNGTGQTAVLNIPYSISYNDKVIDLATSDYVYQYLPYGKKGDDIEVLVKVFQEGELEFVYTGFLVEKKNDTTNFTKHLSTNFPFFQLAYINGRHTFNYDEFGKLECSAVFGYVFAQNLGLERGLWCDEQDELIKSGDHRWDWSIDEYNNVHLNFAADNNSVVRKRTWIPLSTDQFGFTRVLEYSDWKRDSDLDGTLEEDGYLIGPRVNLVRMEDISQYEEYYTKAGFQGDYDGDGVNDSNDTDDDNDGMSDYFENKYGLDHLDSSDASEDNDFDDLTNLEEFRAGTDPSLRDTDNDGVADGRDSDPLDPSVSASQRIMDIRYFDDINGDRIWDWYVATEYEDGYELVIRSAIDDEVLQTLFWNNNYREAQIVKLDDINGDGVDELGLFGFVDFIGENDSLQKAQLNIKDPVSGEQIVIHNWPGNWSDVRFLLATDSDDDGVIDVAIQGKFKDGNRPQLYVKNAVTGEKQAVHSYPAIYSNTEYNWFEDFDGDGIRDISMIGQKSNGKIQVRISSGKNGAKIGAYNFPANYSDFTWRGAGDINGDGNLDYGLLAKRLDDGRVQFFTKSGVSKVGTLGIYSWPDMIDFELFRVRDLTSDDQREFALVGFRESSNRFQMIVKDGRNRNNTLTSTGWPNNWEQVSFMYLGDIDRDLARSTEIGLVGRRVTNGIWQMSIKSTTGANLGQIDLGSEWDQKPELHFTSSNGTLDILVYGEVNGVSTSKNISFDIIN